MLCKFCGEHVTMPCQSKTDVRECKPAGARIPHVGDKPLRVPPPGVEATMPVIESRLEGGRS